MEERSREILFKRPFKKVKIIGEHPHNPEIMVITELEQLEGVRKYFPKRKGGNPDREVLCCLRNNWDETMKVVHYKGKDFLNVFVDGGIHPSNFIITLKNVGILIHELTAIQEKMKSL